jgi:hypothetical protein
MTKRPARPWKCAAKPAALGGRVCGHLNRAGAPYCAGCGCAKTASDARKGGR